MAASEVKVFSVWMRAYCGGVLILMAATCAFPATILVETFEDLDDWQKLTFGDAALEVASEGQRGPCLKATAQSGSALLAYSLPMDAIRGATVLVRCAVKLENVHPGAQPYSTAKIHLAVRDGGRVRHFATRFDGTADWREQALVAQIPASAEDALLKLGLEFANGTALFDSLVVETDQPAMRRVDLAPVANECLTDTAAGDRTGFIDDGHNDLRNLPTGLVYLKDIPFDIAPPDRRGGRACIVLRGEKRPDLPETVEVPIPGGVVAEKIHLLCAAAWGETSRPTPCMICDAHFWDGRVAHYSVFEGRQIGPLNAPQDLPEWRVAWRGINGVGQPIGLGVTEWTIYDRTPILKLSLQAYQGAVPVVVGITITEAKAVITSGEVFDTEGEG